MNFLIDNNLPPHWATAMNAFCKPDRHKVVHLKEKFLEDTEDLVWLETLRKEGGWAVLSSDRYKKSPLERQAFYHNDIPVFILGKAWQNLPYWEQCAKLVRVWPLIIKQTEILDGGGVFELPVKGDRLKQLKV